MNYAHGTYPRRMRGQSPATSSRPTTPEMIDWLADSLRQYSTKEVALLAECSERTAENAKLGRSAFNAASLTALFRNSPELGAAYGEYIGLLRPGEAEMAAAWTRFANAAVRVRP